MRISALRALSVVALGLAMSVARVARADDSDDYPNTLPDDDPPPDDDGGYVPPLRFELELVGVLALPFHSGAAPTSFGFALVYGVGWGDIPVLIGLDFMSADGSNTSKSQVYLSSGGESQLVTKNARNRTLYFDLWARVQPPRWPVRPYIEGFVGTKLLQTKYSFEFATPNTSHDVTDDHDWAGSFGWGAGVDFLGLLNKDGTISLTLGFRRLSGAKAALERTSEVDGQSVVVKHSVPTDVTIFMLGISGRASL